MQDCSQSTKTFVRIGNSVNPAFNGQTEMSNSDQLLFRTWAIIMTEMSNSSLSFRFSELSQPI